MYPGEHYKTSMRRLWLLHHWHRTVNVSRVLGCGTCLPSVNTKLITHFFHVCDLRTSNKNKLYISLICLVQGQEENALLQVMANLAQSPPSIITFPKEEKTKSKSTSQTAYRCTVADIMSQTGLEGGNHSLYALVKAPITQHNLQITFS